MWYEFLKSFSNTARLKYENRKNIFDANDITLREGHLLRSLHCGLIEDFFSGYLRTSTFVLLSHQQALAVFR